MATGDLGEQVELQKEINKLLTDRHKLLRRNKKLSDQICDAAKCAAEHSTGAAGANAQMQAGLRDSLEPAEGLAESFEDIADSAEDASGGIGGALKGLLSSGWVKGAAIIGGLGSVFLKVTGLIGGFIDIMGAAVKGIFSISASIVAIPFKFITGLISMAGNLTGQTSALREAWEDIREVWGDTSSKEGKAVRGNIRGLRREFDQAASSGTKFRRIFGWGHEGLAKASKELLEMSQALGASFHHLSKTWDTETKASLLRLRRGLGLSMEAFGAIGKHAAAMRKDMVKELEDIGKMACHMSEMTGISAKSISRDYGEMTANVKDYGHMDMKTKMSVITWSKRLGIEMKELASVQDRFLNFDNAAESASMLAAAFGANVDVMKLVTAENPADQIEELRRALFATGKSVEDMTLAERRMLEQASGLQGEALNAAFSIENQGMAYADLQQATADAEDKQMSQIDILKELNKGMKRLVHTMSTTGDTFWDFFVKGWRHGIQSSKEMCGLLLSIRRSMEITKWAAFRMARMFMDKFPGVAKMFAGIRAMFDPKTFKKMFTKIEKAWSDFLNKIKDPTKRKEAIKALFDSVVEIGKQWFSAGGDGTSMFLEGGREILETVTELFIHGVSAIWEIVSPYIKNMFTGMAAWIREDGWKEIAPAMDKMFTTVIKWMTKHIGGPGGELAKGFKESLPGVTAAWDDLGNAMKEAWDTDWKPALEEMWKKFKTWIELQWTKTIKPALKSWWKDIGGEDLVDRVKMMAMFGLVVKIAGPILSAAMSAGLSGSMGAGLSGAMSAVRGPMLMAGALVAAGVIANATVNAVAEYKKSGDAAKASEEWGASVLSAFTLGLVDTKTIRDAFATLTDNFVDALYDVRAEMRDETNKLQKEFNEQMANIGDPKALQENVWKKGANLREAFVGLSETLRGGQEAVAGTNAEFSTEMDNQLRKSFRQMSTMETKRSTIMQQIEMETDSISKGILKGRLAALDKEEAALKDKFNSINEEFSRALHDEQVTQQQLEEGLKTHNDLREGLIQGGVSAVETGGEQMSMAILSNAEEHARTANILAAVAGISYDDLDSAIVAGNERVNEDLSNLPELTMKHFKCTKAQWEAQGPELRASMQKEYQGMEADYTMAVANVESQLADLRASEKDMPMTSANIEKAVAESSAAASVDIAKAVTKAEKRALKKLEASKRAEAFLKKVDVEKLLEANKVIKATKLIIKHKGLVATAGKMAVTIDKDASKLAKQMEGIVPKLEKSAHIASDYAVDAVKKIVQGVNDQINALEGIHSLNIGVALNKFAHATFSGASNKAFEIKQGKSEIKLYVTVKMGADKLLSGLCETEIKGKGLALTEGSITKV